MAFNLFPRTATALVTAAGLVILLNSLFPHRFSIRGARAESPLPVIVTTWSASGFAQATDEAWAALTGGASRLDALVTGCSACERLQCDHTVGYGGSPDEQGETTLDSLIMDGPGHRMGAVADLRKVKDAARVARAVMEHTKHSMLAGESATKFAVEMGFNLSSLTTNDSLVTWVNWLKGNCQPNYRQNVVPDPSTSCGPYRPIGVTSASSGISHARKPNREWSHDTIGMVIIDENSDISVGTSTNGATHKVPGRVGDGPIPGAGAYVDNEIGGAAGTGDGDVLMRFLPSYQTVESMRQGMDPSSAAAGAMRRIAKYYPDFKGAIVAANKQGQYGASCHGIGTFSYCMRNPSTGVTHRVLTVPCVDSL